MKKTETGLYILYYNNKVEVYTQQEYNIMYNHNSWWSYVKNKFFQ